MSVYVDQIHTYTTRLPYKQWCHMWTDGPIEELHCMAESIGLKRSWFQDHHRYPHYDLVPSKRALALKAGAIEKDLRDTLRENRRQT